jgi:hypothetical protein
MQKQSLAKGGCTVKVADQSRRWNLVLWPMALVFTVATLLPLWDSIAHVIRPRGAKAELIDIECAAAIVLVDVVFLVAVGYVSLRAHKFGRSYLELTTVPALVGGQLIGTIVIGKPVVFTSPVRISLLCEERRITGNRAGNLSTLWQSDTEVNLNTIVESGTEVSIPVEFSIPADSSPTTHESPYIKWRVAAHGPTVGVDYYATFPIIVISTAAEHPATK